MIMTLFKKVVADQEIHEQKCLEKRTISETL